MVTNEGNKLPPTQQEAEEMPEFTCAACDHSHSVIYQGAKTSEGWHNDWGKIRGVLICQFPLKKKGPRDDFEPCGATTVFEIKGNSISFAPGKLFTEDLSPRVTTAPQESFSDALLAFYGGATRGTVAMCRSAVEEALDEWGAKGDFLFNKIADARAKNILGDEEVAQAQAARLVGKNALHNSMAVSRSQALLALTSTVQLLNHIAKQPKPASQSKTGSSGR